MKNMQKEIPVYLFLGFLESGKTQFIQDSLESEDFNDGAPTLLLVCEEGIEEYNPKKFAAPNVFIEVLHDQSELVKKRMEELTEKYKVEQVVVEYNGMWLMQPFIDAMPDEWIVYQALMLAEAPSFIMYNKNMRNLVYDKLRVMEMIIFNRFEKDMNKEEYHKIVRASNRSAQIIYEYDAEEYEVDDIEDPLPYDINAEQIKIREIDYAIWYRDINEETDKYIGKKVTVKGRSLIGGGLPKDAFVFGRHVMTCCEEDIEFAGFVAKYPDSESKLEHAGWVNITAEVCQEYHEMYGESGPVLKVIEIKKAAPPVEEVATFL